MRAALCVLLLAACHPARPSPPASAFGFYLLSLTWTPSPCCSDPEAPCARAAPALALHGLWPNYTDAQARGRPRAWPQYCGAYAHCEQVEDARCAPGVPVPAELARVAPGYVADPSFATHEWSKHGSCTSLAPAAYFAAELAAVRRIPGGVTPAVLRAAAGKELARADLQAAFGVAPASVVLGCDDRCRLTRVGLCLAKDAGDHPTAATPCTASVTTSAYDNGCVTHHCDRVAIQAAAACAR